MLDAIKVTLNKRRLPRQTYDSLLLFSPLRRCSWTDRADSRSFAPSSTTRNSRLEVNRMKSRIKYSSLSLSLSVFRARRKGRKKRREEMRERERERVREGGWVVAGEEGGGGRAEEEDELTRGETRRSKVPCI